MPSYKPRVTVYTDEITNQKLAYIAKLQNRSSSNYTECLIKQAISNYEAENGEIEIDEPKSIKALKEYAKKATNKNIPISERVKESFTIGFDKGVGKKSKDME